jgi:hypothetical protein
VRRLSVLDRPAGKKHVRWAGLVGWRAGLAGDSRPKWL